MICSKNHLEDQELPINTVALEPFGHTKHFFSSIYYWSTILSLPEAHFGYLRAALLEIDIGWA